MKVEKTILNDAFIIEPDVYGDERGFFKKYTIMKNIRI